MIRPLSVRMHPAPALRARRGRARRSAHRSPPLPRRRGRGLPLAGGLVSEDGREQRVPALDAVLLLALEQPLGATEPPARRAELAPEHVVDAEPERTADGAQPVTSGDVQVMGSLEARHPLVVAAEHVRRRCEQLEVGASSRDARLASVSKVYASPHDRLRMRRGRARVCRLAPAPSEPPATSLPTLRREPPHLRRLPRRRAGEAARAAAGLPRRAGSRSRATRRGSR